MSERPSIHLANPEDVPRVLELIRELAVHVEAGNEMEATNESLLASLSFPNSAPKQGEAYAALITPPSTESNPTPAPVGVALFYYNYSSWCAAPGVYLEDFYVQESARGRGYGLQLMKYLAQLVLDIKGRRLEWNVHKWNKASIGFYKKLNAKDTDEWVKMKLEGHSLRKLAEGSR